MDIVISVFLGVLSLPFYVIVWVWMRFDDNGPLFFVHERVGKNNKVIRIFKFRSMSAHANEDGMAEDPRITRVGRYLRASRIDELPQLWNVVKGDLSLIGPRPEMPKLVRQYEEKIPYYSIRNLITPGLSGWAQLYHKDPPKLAADEEKTRRKLSYDLYYIKNRSLILDVKIALKTIKELLSRRGL